MSQQMQTVHVRKPRDVFEELLMNATVSADPDACILDVVSGTFFRHRERLEPSVHAGRPEDDGVEEVTTAGLDP